MADIANSSMTVSLFCDKAVTKWDTFFNDIIGLFDSLEDFGQDVIGRITYSVWCLKTLCLDEQKKLLKSTCHNLKQSLNAKCGGEYNNSAW